MSDIFDYNDRDFLYQMDDDHALGTDGHIVQNVGNNLGYDINTGELHFTSGWDSSDNDDDDDIRNNSGSGNSSSSHGSSYHRTTPNTNSGSFGSGYKANRSGSSDTELSTGGGIALGLAAGVIMVLICREFESISHLGAFFIWLGIFIVLVLLVYGIKAGVSPASSSAVSKPTAPMTPASTITPDSNIPKPLRYVIATPVGGGGKQYFRTAETNIQVGDQVYNARTGDRYVALAFVECLEEDLPKEAKTADTVCSIQNKAL